MLTFYFCADARYTINGDLSCVKERTFHPVEKEMVRTCMDCEHGAVSSGGGGSSSTDGGARWQWKGDRAWTDFGPAAQLAIKDAESKGVSTTMIDVAGCRYVIDLSKKMQWKESNLSRQRPIRLARAGRGTGGAVAGVDGTLQLIAPDFTPDPAEVHEKVLWECERLIFVQNSWSGKHLSPADGKMWKSEPESAHGGYDSVRHFERTLPAYSEWVSAEWALQAEGDEEGGWEYAFAFPQRANAAVWHQEYNETDVVRRRMWIRRLWVPIE